MQHQIEKLGHTIDEACHAIGIGRTKIYEEIAQKRLRVVKIGRRSIIVNLKEYIGELEAAAGQ